MKPRGKFARRRPTRHARPGILTLEDRRLLAYTVINALDDGSTGSLRWAVEQANNNPGPDTIEFDSSFFSSPRSINLSGSHLDLTDISGQTTIHGPAGGVTINAGGLSRVLVVEPMVSASLSGLTITGGNNPYGYGGGLYSLGDTTLTNCTISGNSAMLGSGASTGGYFSPTGSISLINCTIGGNSGYQLVSIAAPVHAVNTVVAGGYYASFDSASTNNLIGWDVQLAPLGDYGGTSLTMPLLPGSPGIDGGTSTGVPTTDQRGEPRFGGVDIGAFESQGFQFTLVPSSGPQSADIGTAFSYPLAVSVTANNPIEPVDGGGGVIFTPIAAGNGATAMLDTSAPVISGGVAAVTAVPNNALGSYVVDVSFPGSSASLSLENTGSVFTSFVVNTTSDSLTPGAGLLSLREAIAFNHHSPSGIQPISFDANVFSTPQTITLSGSPLEMSNPDGTFTINGPAGGVTIDGAGLSRVFVVDSLVTAEISGLTITGGRATSVPGGGGILNQGSLTLRNVRVNGNVAGVTGPYFASSDMNGGGIANLGTLAVESSVIDGNSAFSGGGISSTGQLEIVNSSIRGNSASFDGGGLRSDGLLSMTGGEVCDNVVNGYLQGIGGGISNRGEASLIDCTISGNSTSAIYLGYGGGIANFGSLTLTNSEIRGNSAVLSSGYGGSYGGGLMNGNAFGNPGAATLVDCVISGNSADRGGGVNNSGSSLDMTGCTLIGNTASNSGGGLLSAGSVSVFFTPEGVVATSHNAVATLVDCEISGNDAGVDGGGLVTKGRDYYGATATGTLNLTNCTVSGNSAGGAGGGLVVDALGTGTLSNATIGGNTSGGDGGGIANNNGTLSVTQSTITDNTTQGSGGGIHQGGTGATALTNSLISGNHAGEGASRVADNLGGESSGFSGEGNLIGSGAVSLDPTTNLVGIDNALLAPLGNYGSPTQTYALLPGSPAIDAALDAYATERDQRGWGRVGRADIGAFESQGFTLTPVAGSTPQTTMIGAAFNRPIAVTVKANNAVEPVNGGVVTFQAPASGASATLSATTAVIADGTASVDATANGELGSYAVAASTAGAATPASFALTNTSAMVGDVSVGWGSQTAALFTDADGVRLLPAGRENTIGWTNIRSFTVHLLGAGSLSANDVSVIGENGTNYGPVTVTSLGGGTYRITLARPIVSAGRTTLTISNATVGTYTRRLDVLPGDINDDGLVNASDLNALKLYLVGRTTSPPISGIPSIYFDLDGSGTVTLSDYLITVLAIGLKKTKLP